MKLVAAFALAAVASAQEITSLPNGSPAVTRRQTSELADIDVRIAEASAFAERAAFNATLEATFAMTNTMNAMQASMNSQMAAMQASISAAAVAQVSSAAAMKSTMASRFDSLSTAVASSLDESSTNVAAALSTSAAEVSTKLAASAEDASKMVVQSASRMTALNASLINTMNAKAPIKRHIWMGGSSRHQHSCWQDVPMDRVTHDSARPKFYKRTNTRMRALVSGVFRFDFFQITTSCHWGHTSIMVDGSRVTHTHQENRYHWWIDQHNHLDWKVPAGKDFWFQICSRCGHTSHSHGQYQRLQFEWKGDW